MIQGTFTKISMEKIIKNALLEDLGQNGDITSDSIIDSENRSNFSLVSRSDGILSGLPIASLTFETMDKNLEFSTDLTDGDELKKGTIIGKIKGNTRSILSGERTALNFLSHLSGIATATNQMVQLIKGTKVKIVSTRKTTPNLRVLEKNAVKNGGGVNHRFGLYDGILIKDNHIAISGSIKESVLRAKSNSGHMVKVEIEVDNLSQYKEAIETNADAILLDNFNLKDLKKAVSLNEKNITLEASGKINKNNISDIARTGIDLISSGWITHSSPALDIGLDYE
ncbi:carboxylating nicotinate-nucleotide diphosphorylase [Hyphomicrobiales bacterium]|nr:carboxylating nicotinate-nucleotide diphosphorylase [Hyphomicrobiales bacterium]